MPEDIRLGTCRTLIEWTPRARHLGPTRLVEFFSTHVAAHLILLAGLFFRKEILELLLGSIDHLARVGRNPLGRIGQSSSFSIILIGHVCPAHLFFSHLYLLQAFVYLQP